MLVVDGPCDWSRGNSRKVNFLKGRMATQTSGLPIVFGVKVACRAAGGAVPAASLSLGKVLPVIVSAGMKALVLFSFCWLRFFLSGDTPPRH